MVPNIGRHLILVYDKIRTFIAKQNLKIVVVEHVLEDVCNPIEKCQNVTSFELMVNERN